MQEFSQRVADPHVAHDIVVLGRFTQIYCEGKHDGAAREPLVSPGVDAGVYGDRVPVVCEECRELLVYAEQRRVRCTKDPKPACKDCDTHCYRPAMRQKVRDVMRYAGPRAVFHGMIGDAVSHALSSHHRHAV